MSQNGYVQVRPKWVIFMKCDKAQCRLRAEIAPDGFDDAVSGACTTGAASAERTDDFVTGSPDDGAPAGGCG